MAASIWLKAASREIMVFLFEAHIFFNLMGDYIKGPMLSTFNLRVCNGPWRFFTLNKSGFIV
ncbi:MAG: hypothetical protein CVU53_05410 [Deltaproteobacteria bacterium HGW-Deltaproteobacteria-11]|nr:MAG: hypothetical protein CVU53_05410 [Deltaproteobacteria bacterium HGW-Deltaproteobacteria-11]